MTFGLLLHVLVHEATVQDYHGGKLLLTPLLGCFPRMKLIWADSGYKKGGFVEWVKATRCWQVEIVEHPWSGIRRGCLKASKSIGSRSAHWLSCAQVALDRGVHDRLALHLA